MSLPHPPSVSLQFEKVGRVGLMTLQRPDKRNALDDATIDALDRLLSDLPAGLRVLVLRGAGEHFCAGLDLAERQSRRSRTPLEAVRHSRRWHRVFERLQFGELPVVCVLQGGVIGGGLELAAATHVRVAEASAFYQLPEAQRGIFLGGGGTARLPRLIGAGRVVEMMLTGRRLDAAEGQAIGLSHYRVAEGAGLAKALELAEGIAENAEVSNYAVIQGAARIAEMSLEDGLFTEAMVGALGRASADSTDADGRIARFLQGRGDPTPT